MADISKVRMLNGTEYNYKDAKARSDIEGLKADLADVNEELGISPFPISGSATHISGTTSNRTTIMTVPVEAGETYSVTFSLSEPVAKTVYCYIRTADDQTNIVTTSISSGSTSATRTFTASTTENCILSFTVAAVGVTAGAVVEWSGMQKTVLDTLQEAVEKNAEFIDTVKVLKQYGNIYEIATDEIDNKYYYRNNRNLAQGTNTSYKAFIIKVTPDTKYTFVKSDIVLLDADKKPLAGTESWDYKAVTTCNSGNAEYMAVDVIKSDIPTTGYIISQGTALDSGAYSTEIYAKTIPSNILSPIAEISGNIPANGTMTLLGKTAIKDGQNIIFKSEISSFNEITLNFSGGQSVNYIKVDATNLTVRASSADAVVYPHGLTITNDLTLLVELIDGTAVISLTSRGVTFKQTVIWNQSGGTVTESQIVSTGTVCTDAKLINVYSAVSRKVWYFGDSYAQFNTDTRIPFYLHQYGFDKNILISAVSGGTSGTSRIAFETLLAHGKPDFAVFATGINNGSDSEDAPQATWLSGVQSFINDCIENDVVPILCTLPTIPSVNNENKNEWVRVSGYRYVDYAKAVGANASGQWHTGMLSNDNVHPSTLGGNALFTQLITDLPEVILAN